MNQDNLHTILTYSQKFSELNQLLEQSTSLWQMRAFEASSLPWAAKFPHLAEAVWAIADENLDKLDADQGLLVDALSPALDLDLKTLGLKWNLALLRTSNAELIDSADANKPKHISATRFSFEDEAHFSAHIKGRKWEQIHAFVQHLPHHDLPVLEWCAGKGHLGRLIAKARGVDVVSLEWQEKLCEEGQAFAHKWQLSQRFICVDAFDIVDSALNGDGKHSNPLYAQQHAVALHACGDLHVRLLTLAATAGTQALAISPCCYHLIRASHYQPLSTVAKQSALTLTRHDLQLPLQQSVIASPKQQTLRHQEIAWRLGFDALQRQYRNVDEYLPIPSIKQSQLSGCFADSCLWAATQKSVNLPQHIDFNLWLETGYQRQRLTRRIDLVAHLFRSVLEQWLILDRCCFLQEQGYQVSVSEFCANSVTPRNALILALKSVD